jgi:aminoglycoside phosphotransferase (APT) family kinase protein
MAATPEEIRRKLQAYLRAEVGEVTSLSAGWESDVYGFEVETSGGAERRVARLYFGEHSSYTAQRESSALRLLGRAGYPVPQVFVVEPSPEPLGRPFMVMSYAPGRLLWPLMLLRKVESDTQAEDAARHLKHFCELFAGLHRLDAAAFDAAPHDLVPRRSVMQQLTFLEAYGGRFPVEGAGAVLAWLKANAVSVTAQPPAPIHWDFHPANVLVDDDGNYTVIDWTQFELSDARFDLAWTLVLVGSQAAWDHATRLLAGYEEAAGAPVADLAFFEAAACAKRLVAILVSLRYGAESMGMRPEATQAMSANLHAVASLYRRWLELTDLPIAEAERQLSGHL